MPAPVTSDTRRRPSLLTVLFWAGVALAPVAALILLVADGNGPLRFAAVLAIVSVVLIGLSIALRADDAGASARADELQDEIEELRTQLATAAQRGSQALDQAHRAQEGIAAVRRRLDASGAALAGAAPVAAAAPVAEPAGAGRARVPSVEPPGDNAPVARSRVSVPGDAPPGRARVPGPDDASRWGHPAHPDDGPAHPREAAEPRATAGTYGAQRPADATYGSARRQEHDRPEPAHRPLGVVRHTETVHVTTRHTVVDGGPAEPGGHYGGEPGGHYGGEHPGRWTPPAQEWARGGGVDERARTTGRPAGEPGERPRAGYGDDRARPGDNRVRGPQPPTGGEPEWSGAREASGWGPDRNVPDRDGHEPGRTGRRDEPEWTDPRDTYDEPGPAAGPHQVSQRPTSGSSWDSPDERGWSERRDRAGAAAPQPGPALRADDTGEYWSQLRAGDRWAAVRDDEDGHELRVGERRAEVRTDATGTEYRMADRWAAVRHEEPRRHEQPRGHEEPRRHEERESYQRDEPARRHDRDGGWRAEQAGRPALPVGGVPVPDEWRPPRQRGHQAEPAPERTGRRRVDERYGYPPQDDVPRAGGTPPAEHWR
ncbi:hypothetical protein ACGFIW_13965 [Micromonospora sp. NPDC048935]|uniref:hypothetical protein n=1 Tax=Micromonospora sp. NPDC048935 TaxID=3364262 RepID=UPI003718727F